MPTPFFLTHHFWAYYFTGYHVTHAYEAAVWGNVIAILPSAPVVFVGGLIVYFWHKGVTDRLHARIDELAASHAQHAEHMKRVLDLLEPEDGDGIADIHLALAAIRDDLNPGTPTGVGVLDSKVDRLLRHLKVPPPPGEPGRAVE